MTERAIIYVRVSTSRQAESDLSIPDQIERCQSYCRQHGWEVVDVFTEPGASALDEDRPVFQEMIYRATKGNPPVKYVVVHSLSRFSRDSLHSEFYFRQLRKSGVELVSITQDIGLDGSGEFIRKILNVFDEHQSRENAKHVHRAMLENARQGFWNGARPPYGYGVKTKELRGTKEKKILVVNEEEARVVQQIFALATGGRGRPMGVKAIATHLSERGILRRGLRFSTGSVYEILTSTTYAGRHYFNRFDSRTRRPHPPSQWVELPVPAIIDDQTFNTVQGLLQERNPKRVPPRVVNGPTILAGIARCGHCGAALIQNTGKGGAYRYYCCSRKLKEGPIACEGIRMPMQRLDDIVIGEVAKRILDPARLSDLLGAYLQSANERSDRQKSEIGRLRQSHRDTLAALSRLLGLVENGLIEVEDPTFKQRLVGLKLQRDELAVEISELQRRLNADEPDITPAKIERFASLLRDRLLNGEAEFRQAYARLVMREVAVTTDEIRISGSKTVLAHAISKGAEDTPPAVLSFVREWRTRQDSNL